MKFSTVFAAAAFVAGVSAKGNGKNYTTEVVTAYTTYCPYATTLTHNSKTYTVTSPTTLTITDCPCTVTRPMTSVMTSSCPPTMTPMPYSNSTAPYQTTPAQTSGAASPSGTMAQPSTFAGAGNQVYPGAGVAAIMAAAAYIL